MLEKKTGKTRFHFDIFVADRSAPMEEIVATVDAKVAELVDLGATVDHPVRIDTDTLQRYSVVMHDPEGTSSAWREAWRDRTPRTRQPRSVHRGATHRLGNS